MKLVVTIVVAAVALVAAFGCQIDPNDDFADVDPDTFDPTRYETDDPDDDAAADDDAGDDDAGDDDGLPEGTVQVVPSVDLPKAVQTQNANNNLDVAYHNGRVYLAFRTAPTHFASPLARIYVISSEDQIAWRYEGEFWRGRDLREPRLLSWNGRLFLYFAVLGTNSFDFEPGGMMVTELDEDGSWSEPAWFYGEGFIPWRAKVVNGTPYMLAYIGGESIYDFFGAELFVHFLTTADGRNWVPVVPGSAAVLQGGCSETDFVLLDDGSLVSVCRNEAGDADGFGSKICTAPADDLADWTCAPDPRKFDSPLMFRDGGDVYIIGRRNVTDTGNFDLMRDDLPAFLRGLFYSADYWFRQKRCAVWSVDADAMEAAFAFDLPSRGDTCFPGLLDNGDGTYEVYNYSSPVDGPDVFWLAGQLGPTNIYRTTIELP
ncbi:hypothetical protein K8I61_09650 [bacterium]|nr:hypothetical protein [bacterium]